MSKLVKEIIGAVLIVVGVLTGNLALVIEGSLILGSALLTPGIKQQAKQAEVASLQLGEVPRQGIFGTVLVGGSLNDAIDYDGKYGTDWEVLPITLADHYCEALLGFYVNDTYVAYTGDGLVPGYNGKLSVIFHHGTESQAASATLMAHGDWSANDRLVGLCWVEVGYKADASDEKNPTWPSGRPRFRWLVKGKRCYQPRKDSTVAGGSGTHRWNDPSTWEWTDNLSDCRYNWARGIYACDRIGQPEMLLVGRGLSAIEAPPENVAWRANLCDEDVPLAAGGTEKRYRFNGLIKADETYLTTEERFAAACGGVIAQPEGSVEVDPGYAVTTTFEFTDDDVIIAVKATSVPFRSVADNKYINTVIPRYVEPNQQWADHAAPIRRNYLDVIADGGPREATLSLGDVISGPTAQRIAEIARRQGREGNTFTRTLGPRFAGVRAGDWGIYTSARHTKGVPMVVRVEAHQRDQKWQMTLSLRRISGADYDWDTSLEIAEGAVATTNPVPTYGAAPDVSEWAITGAALTGSNGEVIPAITVEGEATDPYASLILVEYRQRTALLNEDGSAVISTEDGKIILAEGDPPAWTTETHLPAGATSYVLRSVAAGGVYEVGISYLVRGTYSDPLVLGPVQAGSLAVARASYEIVGYNGPIYLSSDATNIYVAAFDAGLDDGRRMSFPAATIAGLANSTKYGAFWNLTSLAYEAEASPGLTRKLSTNFVFLGWQTTSDGSGTYPPPTTLPPGYGGDGPRELLLA